MKFNGFYFNMGFGLIKMNFILIWFFSFIIIQLYKEMHYLIDIKDQSEEIDYSIF